MAHTLAHRLALAVGLTATVWSCPAWAAADYYIKIGDIEGEARAATAGDHRHKDWIELDSLRFQDGVKTYGGATVSSGDVNGDGSPARLRAERSAPAAPGRIKAAPAEAVPVGLLLPGVQKIRSSMVRTRAWPGCRVGQRLRDVSLREGPNGRVVRVLDARVTECASEHVSLNFSKIR